MFLQHAAICLPEPQTLRLGTHGLPGQATILAEVARRNHGHNVLGLQVLSPLELCDDEFLVILVPADLEVARDRQHVVLGVVILQQQTLTAHDSSNSSACCQPIFYCQATIWLQFVLLRAAHGHVLSMSLFRLWACFLSIRKRPGISHKSARHLCGLVIRLLRCTLLERCGQAFKLTAETLYRLAGTSSLTLSAGGSS